MAIDLNLPFAQSLISEGKARGYNDLQISQILGSAMQENGLRTDGKPGDNGTAYGGFQWRLEREQALKAKAQAAGVDWTDPNIQSKHWYDELDNGPEKSKGARLRAAQTPEEAQAAVISALRPFGFTPQNPQGGHGWSNRLNNGNQIYSMLTGGQFTPSATAVAGGGNPADAPAPGAATAEGQQPSAMAQAFAASQGAAPVAQPVSAWDKLGQYLNGGKSWNLADALQGAGVAAMARDNAAGASAMASGMNAQTARDQNKKGGNDWQSLNFNAETGKGVFMNKTTGQIQERQIASPFRKLSDKEMEVFNERQSTLSEYDGLIREGDKYRNMIADGKLDLSAANQFFAGTRNLTNTSTEADRNAADYSRYLERMRNAAVNLMKGVATDKDAARAMNEYVGGLSKFDNSQALKGLDNIIERQRKGAFNTMSAQETILNTYGAQAPQGSYRDDYKRYRTEYEDFDKAFGPKRESYLRAREAAQNAPAAAPRVQPGRTGSIAAPEVGTIQKGYRFKGGNPADPNSWEKQ